MPATVVALGGPSLGHEALVVQLHRRADALGIELLVTGPLSEPDLHAAARATTVPLAAYRPSSRGSWPRWGRQTHRPLDVVVSDDGSRTVPVVPPGVSLVRQDDQGFRAAAARNLGAAASDADVLVFLDADTVPEPGFVAALVRRAAACLPRCPAVGRRRHGDLSGRGVELPEPAWLVEAYAASRDRLDADGRSFRHVISAVLARRRTLFEDLGGFDERFIGTAARTGTWPTGPGTPAVLVHERDAVAWHDGPEWAARDRVPHSTRALGRTRRWAGRHGDVVGVAFGRVDVAVEPVAPRDDLAGFFAAPWTPDR